MHVRNACVLADLQHRRPRLATIGRLEEAALAAGRPQATHRRRVHHVRIARVNQDLADVFRGPQPGVRPGASAVQALVDAVAPPDAALAGVLAGAEPDDVGVGGIDGDRARGVRGVVVEDGRPGGAPVLGLPHVRRARRHVPNAPVRGIDGHVGDAPGHEGRADAAQFEGREEVLVDGGGWGCYGATGGLGLERGEDGEDDGQGQCGGGGWGEEGGVRRTHNWHS